MAKSETKSNAPPPILGGLFNSDGGYKTTITSDSGKTYTGYGGTAKESQSNASRKYERDNS